MVLITIAIDEIIIMVLMTREEGAAADSSDDAVQARACLLWVGRTRSIA